MCVFCDVLCVCVCMRVYACVCVCLRACMHAPTTYALCVVVNVTMTFSCCGEVQCLGVGRHVSLDPSMVARQCYTDLEQWFPFLCVRVLVFGVTVLWIPFIIN